MKNLRHDSRRIMNVLTRKFCETNVKDLIQKNDGAEVMATSDETRNKLAKLNKSIPLEKFDKNELSDAVKYKIFEDSVAPTVKELSKDVPQIKGHEDLKVWVDSVIEAGKQDEVLKETGMVILRNKSDVFHKYGIDMSNYRRFHDRDYEVDIHEVLTKDLFKKQRVVDEFVEDNREKLNELIGYYENRFQQARPNKYSYLIYQNNYLSKLSIIKKSLLKNITAVGLTSVALGSLYPGLLILMVPDFFAIAGFCYQLNNTVDQIILGENKTQIIIRTFNFFGFRREYKIKFYDIVKLSYLGKFKNNFLQLKDKGLFLLTRLARRMLKPSEKKEYDNFSSFHKLSYYGTEFYVPADLSDQHKDTNEELLVAIMNNDLKFVYRFDYSPYQEQTDALVRMLDEFQKEKKKKSHEEYYTHEERLKQEYSKYVPNRDYSDRDYANSLKRRGGNDGVYINNGYR